MTTRCIACNSLVRFEARRGSRLVDVRCRCGSKVEKMNWYTWMGDLRLYKNKSGAVYTLDADQREFFHGVCTKAFMRDDSFDDDRNPLHDPVTDWP